MLPLPENRDYTLAELSHINKESIDEILDLILETACSKRKKILVAGDEYPAELGDTSQ